jgi:membrane associated rhomboid family serine protease
MSNFNNYNNNYNNYRSNQSNPLLNMPPVIKNLIIINLTVFILQFLLENFRIGNASISNLFFSLFALQPLDNNMIGITSDFYPWQLISYQFMHGGFFHLFFNMFALYMFGIELENLWGSRKFLIYYLLCGVGAGLLQIFTADAPTVGASGSVYGLLAAFGMTYPNRQVMMFPLFIPIPAKFFVVIFGAIELLSGFNNSSSGVAHFAHVAGAVTGVFLLLVGPKLGIFKLFSKYDKKSNFSNTMYRDYNEDKPYYDINDESSSYKQRNENLKVHNFNEPVKQKPAFSLNVDGEDINQAKINVILDKINASGYQSLTDKEKHILIEISKKL